MVRALEDSESTETEELKEKRDRVKKELDEAKQKLEDTEYRLSNCERRKSDQDSTYTDAKSYAESKEAEYKSAVTEEETAAKNDESAVQAAQEQGRTNDQELSRQANALASAKLNNEAADYTDEDIQIRKYQSVVDACTITAPFDGTVTSVAVKPEKRIRAVNFLRFRTPII